MSTRKDFSVVALLQPPYRPKRHVDCRFPSHSSFFPFFFFLLSKAHRWSIHPHTQPRFDVRPDTLIDRGIYFFSYLSSHCPPLSHLFSFFHSLPPSLPLTSTSVHRSLASSFSKNAPPSPFLSVERPLHPPTITDPRRSLSPNPRGRGGAARFPILFPFSLPRGCTDSCEIKPRAMTPPRLSGDCILA